MNVWTCVLLAASTLTAHVGWRRGAHAMAVCAGGFAVLLVGAVLRQLPPVVAFGLVGVGATAAWQRWVRSAAIVNRWGLRSRRTSGVASRVDIFRYRGAFAMRRRAGTLRPSLRATGWTRVTQLLRLPVTEVAVPLCRTGGVRVWSASEEVVLEFGGPRKGKSQSLAGAILDAPGAVIATSTRLDLLDQIGPMRAEHGPVFVFNPVGLGGRTSTITFDPLIGCTDPVTAMERAADMIGGGHSLAGSSGDREFWDEQGRRVLAALMHAAALGAMSMDTVQDWLADLDGYQQEITRLLRDRSTEPGFVAAINQFIGTNDRTRTSITATIAPALGWLTHGPARAAALPAGDGGHPFDVETLLDTRALVFIVGGEEAQVTPLVCALTGYIAREARRLAAFRPGGRLDPPLSLRLDECALICPVPLHQWTADMGGRGVNIVACFQSRAQLVDRYGEAKAATIINNSGARVLYGGTADRDDLTYWSSLAGERDEWVPALDANGRTSSRHLRRVPVLPVAQLATLPPARVVVFTSDIPPVIGWAEQAWRRRDVRAHHNPDALAVRTRAGIARHRATAGRWIAARARGAARTVGGRLAALWVTVTARRAEHGWSVSYRPLHIVNGHVVEPSAVVIPLNPRAPRQALGPAPNEHATDERHDDGNASQTDTRGADS